MKRSKKLKLWLLLAEYDGKWDFYRSSRKGYEIIYCSDKRKEIYRKFKTIPEIYRVISTYVDTSKVGKADGRRRP